MKIPLKSLGLIGCFAALGGCRTEPPNTFKFTADLPPGFAYVAAVYYVPEKGQTCTVDRRDNLAPVFNSKWRTDYKPDAEITIRKIVKGCPLVVRKISLEINSAYGKDWGDISGDQGMVIIRDVLEEQYKNTFNDAGEASFTASANGGSAQWGPTAVSSRFLIAPHPMPKEPESRARHFLPTPLNNYRARPWN